MKKQTILALALKPAMRVTKSVDIGIVLLLAAALVAMITPSAASGRRACPGPTATLLVTGLDTGLESRTRWRAVRHRRRSRQDLARRSADRGEDNVRQWSAACHHQHRWGVHRWGDRRRVHRQHRVRAGHPRQP